MHSRNSRSETDERGVALVEMALLTPFLVLLLLGMIEFGWLFAQNLDIKHGAREAARMLSVNDDPGGGGTQSQNIINGVCASMDLYPGTTVQLIQSGTTRGFAGLGGRIDCGGTEHLDRFPGLGDPGLDDHFLYR